MSEPQESTRAVLKSFFAADAPDGDLSRFRPDDPMNYGLDVMAFITTPGSEEADSFDFVVCSPRWLADRYEEGPDGAHLDCPAVTWSENLLFGAGLVLLAPWDFPSLERSVRMLCDGQAGPDWGAVASRIGRVLPWESAYRYDAHLDLRLSVPYPSKGWSTRSEAGS